MGIFSTLTVAGAERIFKFKMSKMRDLARSSGHANSDHVSILSGGICTGYTLLWCREQFNPGVFSFDLSGDYVGSLSETGGGVAMLGVRLQTLYQKMAERWVIEDAQYEIGRAVGLLLDVDNSLDLDDLQDALIHANTHGPAVYFCDVNMEIDREIVSHAIGMIKSVDGSLFVFDANCGEYRVKFIAGFALNLEVAYAKIYKNVSFKNVHVTLVTPRN